MTENTFTEEQLGQLDGPSILKLADLAATVFNKEASELTKTDILMLLELELGTVPTKLTVTADEVRRTSMQYCTWRGGMSMEMDLSGLKDFVRGMVKDSDNAVEDFLKASNYIRLFVLSKLRRGEKTLREEMNRAIVADGLERIPEGRFANTVF